MNKTNDLSHFYFLLIIVLLLAFTKCSSNEQTNKINPNSQVINYPNGPMVKSPYPDLTVIDTLYVDSKELNWFATDTSLNYYSDIYEIFRHLIPDSTLKKMSLSKNLKISFLANKVLIKKDNLLKINYSYEKRDSILNCYCKDLIIMNEMLNEHDSNKNISICEALCKIFDMNLDSVNINKNISKLNKKWINRKWPNEQEFDLSHSQIYHNILKDMNLPNNITYPYKYGSSKPSTYYLPPIEDEIMQDLKELENLYYIRSTPPLM